MAALSKTAREHLESAGKTVVLSTADASGRSTIAIFGSASVADDSTVKLLLGDNRTSANLRENPRASMLVIRQGTSGMQTQGCRLYLAATRFETDGAEFDAMKEAIRARAGKAAEMLRSLVTFEVTEERPVVEMN